MGAKLAEPIVLVSQDAAVGTITLNRPKQLNTLSEEMIAVLQEALGRLAGDEELRCLVIAANGTAFCAGHDLKEMRARRTSEQYFKGLFARCSRMMQTITSFPVPVIAKVQGIATAGGCQLAAACDLVIASSDAKFAVSGINAGLFCSTPAVPLSRSLHAKQAFEMLVTGRFVAAEEAQRLGLVSRVVTPDQLDAATDELSSTISSKSGAAIRLGKSMFARQRAMRLDEAYDYAGQIQAANLMLDDAGEGLDAFVEKRKPIWRHR